MIIEKYIKSLTVVLVLAFLYSCSGQEEEPKPKPLTYSYQTVERLHPNCNDQENNNRCVELKYKFPTFTGGGDVPVKDTLRKAVARFLFDTTGTAVSKKSFDRLAREWFSLYDSTLIKLPDYSLDWEQKMQVTILHETPSYYSVEFSEYGFMGGTHGTEINVLRMYGIPSGKQFDLEDLLKEDKKDQLAILAETYFRDIKEVPDDVEYDERDYHFKEGVFALNRNFALTKEGLLFHYNPYEIAPYSEGATKILLPYEQIDSLLADTLKPSSVVNKQ